MTRSGFEYSISEPDRISEAENTTHWKVGALLQPSQSKIYLDCKLETRNFFSNWYFVPSRFAKIINFINSLFEKDR